MDKNEKLTSNPVYVEVLQHLKACYNSCKVFQGREEIGNYNNYIQDLFIQG